MDEICAMLRPRDAAEISRDVAEIPRDGPEVHVRGLHLNLLVPGLGSRYAAEARTPALRLSLAPTLALTLSLALALAPSLTLTLTPSLTLTLTLTPTLTLTRYTVEALPAELLPGLLPG